MKSSPAIGAPDPSRFAFFAEQDLLCALSTCPGGDLSKPMWGRGAEGKDAALSVCRPLQVDVFTVDERLLAAWEQPRPSAYRMH